MKIGGFQKTSLIDYPKKIAAVVFTQGCNFRCGYCHNPELIEPNNESLINENEIIGFLKTRIGKLDAVVITGGEPCLQSGLIDFVLKIKELGYLVKLDTNGSYPEKISELLDKKIVDHIAMDVKAPIQKYESVSSFQNTDKILESINLIMNSDIDYEFRTTILKSQLSFDDLKEVSFMIKGAKKYYLQQFVPTKLLDESLIYEESYLSEELNKIVAELQKNIESIYIR